MRTLIRNGRVVTAVDDYKADILIEGETVSTIGAKLDVEADRVIDAAGKLVIPGGIDPHTHMELPFGGAEASDDFRTGTIAAAHGGTTSIIDFAVQYKGQSLVEGLDNWHKKAEGKCVIDYGFHLITTEFEDGQTEELYTVMDEGVTSFKLFMAYPGVFLADEAPVYIVHLSCADALNQVREARDRGLPAFAETCPQYLFLSIEDYGEDFEGAKYVMTPPLRERWNQDELWKGLKTDDLQVVSTDHCPFCMKEQKELGRDDFTKIPNGAPGVEHRMSLIYHGGVFERRVSLNRFVELTSTAAAKMFGLFPRKGTVAVGSDADIVVFDPEREQTISAATHHMNVDYSAYEGRKVQGTVETVLSRGNVVVEGGEFKGRAGAGQFLKRGTCVTM